jgi:hypothetical protein
MNLLRLPTVALLFILLSSPLFAQVYEATWGNEIVNPRKTFVNGIVGGDEEHFYVFRRAHVSLFFSKPKLILEKYSKEDLSLVYSRELKLTSVKSKKVHFEQIFCLKGKIILFTSFYDKATEMNTAFAQEIDENGKISKEFVEVDQIKVSSKRNNGNFAFALSDDSTRILVYHNPPFEKYADEKFSYKLFDTEMNLIWEKKFSLPFKDKNFTIGSYEVDNDGNVHMLARIVLPNTETGLKKIKQALNPSYSFRVISYYHKQDEIKDFELALPTKGSAKKYVNDITFNVNSKGDVICAGFYGNKAGSGINGAFYMRVDRSTREVVADGYKEFGKDFLGEFMSARKAKKNKGLYNYDLKYLITREDGSATLIAEQYYVVVVCSTNPKTGQRTCSYHYYYNDIIAVNVNSAGAIDWCTKIPKRQHSVNDGGYYSSFIFSLKDHNMFFMFNENPRNMKPPKKGSSKSSRVYYMNKPRKSVAVVVSLDAQGSTQKETLFSSKEAKFILRPKVHYRLGGNETVIYSEKHRLFQKSKYRFGLVRVN